MMTIELQDVLHEFGAEYLSRHRLPVHHFKAINAIERCRTSELGGHVEECDECGHVKISYNSCRNRHCPKCQKLSSAQWTERRKDQLLPVQYFHTVFTLPDLLNPIIRFNQKELYGLLFKAASETLLELARDKKYLGAEIGFTAVLHTWGQTLVEHPHLHCIVPGGGLSAAGNWISVKQDFFIPVKVLSRKFKGKFLAFLRQSFERKELKFNEEQNPPQANQGFNSLINQLYSMEWVVFCKESFKNSGLVIEYLGRYTHRVAISNRRIKSIHEGKVAFEWKDRKDGNKLKLMHLDGIEFLRRFLLHILPVRFMKIRHYGLLCNRNRPKIMRCQAQLNSLRTINSLARLSARELVLKLFGIDMQKCPCCDSGKMKTSRRFDYNSRHLLQ